MRILVTGGAGYLGSILVPHLLASGHEVTVLDNFMYKQNSLATCCANESFDVINADVRNIEIIKKIIPSYDVIIPLAALVGAPICSKDPVGSTSINKDAILNSFDL